MVGNICFSKLHKTLNSRVKLENDIIIPIKFKDTVSIKLKDEFQNLVSNMSYEPA